LAASLAAFALRSINAHEESPHQTRELTSKFKNQRGREKGEGGEETRIEKRQTSLKVERKIKKVKSELGEK
jgi:hypothetical protein